LFRKVKLRRSAGKITQSTINLASLYAELWTSLASLLRSYTAVHGLHNGSQAAIHSTNETITARHGKKSLILTRNDEIVTWTRENGSMGTLELTISGNLRASKNEEAMDLAAERWARELMLGPSGVNGGE
jgi:hypothetical protein